MIKRIDAKGDPCPIPVVKTRSAIKELTESAILEIEVDNDTAVKNVVKMAASMGLKAASEKIADDEFKITIPVDFFKLSENEPSKIETAEDSRDGERKTVVVLSSNKMGEGNEELGGVLMKGFLFALTKLDILPNSVLLYNGGAKLSAEGSDSLEDLRYLEEQGVEILTCGTCLNYYNLTDKLGVGSVTNMYTITEKLSMSEHIIKP